MKPPTKGEQMVIKGLRIFIAKSKNLRTVNLMVDGEEVFGRNG